MKTSYLKHFWLIVIGLLVFSTPALAHKVRVFAWQEGSQIYTESRFSRGKPAIKAHVSLIDTGDDTILEEGVTDSSGNFTFKVPTGSTGQLKIVVNSGDGHMGSWLHHLEPVELITESDNSPHIHPATEKQNPKLMLKNTRLSSEELNLITTNLERILDQKLDQKLAPIKKSLAQNSDKKVSLQEIVGAIGYLIGLGGIAAYFQSKKD